MQHDESNLGHYTETMFWEYAEKKPHNIVHKKSFIKVCFIFVYGELCWVAEKKKRKKESWTFLFSFFQCSLSASYLSKVPGKNQVAADLYHLRTRLF